MFFKNRNFDTILPIIRKLSHKSVIVPYANDCSFELLFDNIEEFNLNFTCKKIAIMWSMAYSNLELFWDSIMILKNMPLDSLNKNLIESQNNSIIAASCFLLMFQTNQENLYGNKKEKEVDSKTKDKLRFLSKRKINFSFNKQDYDLTALQDLSYLNDEEKLTLSKYKNFLFLTNKENDLHFFDSCYASKIDNYYLLWSKK